MWTVFRLSQGGLALGPRGTPHAFQNVGDTLGRLLVRWPQTFAGSSRAQTTARCVATLANTPGMSFGRRLASRRLDHAITPATFVATALVISTPSGLERFFEQFAELPAGPVDRDRLATVGHANWIEFVGPPLAVSDPL